MHAAALRFVEQAVNDHGPFRSVIEIGSRDINGSVRSLFKCDSYAGLDLYDGPSVDWVGNACDYQPAARVECVVCCEVLEHAPDWEDIVGSAASWLSPGGCLIITCAGPSRRPHSGIDGKKVRPAEHYGNIETKQLTEALSTSDLRIIVCRQLGRDIQAIAQCV